MSSEGSDQNLVQLQNQIYAYRNVSAIKQESFQTKGKSEIRKSDEDTKGISSSMDVPALGDGNHDALLKEAFQYLISLSLSL